MSIEKSTTIDQFIWDLKYRLKFDCDYPEETSIEDTWKRISHACAKVEKDPKYWEKIFYEALLDYKLIPAGRIIAWAGTNIDVTLINTFFMGKVEDDFDEIFSSLQETAKTLRYGGGIGCDFSSIRPRNAKIEGSQASSSGPIPFLHIWDQMCSSVMTGGIKRGAMMALMHCSHPDIEEFIESKKKKNQLNHFNLSVLITDEFMNAVNSRQKWKLEFQGKVYKTIDALELWNKILRFTYKYSEPGVIFIDRVNQDNKLSYCETIIGTNSCGEQPLPYYGSAPLASINLASLISNPFTEFASLDLKKFESTIFAGIRLLDNILDISKYPLEMQIEESKSKRRIGLGITGLADALIMCNEEYGSERSIKLIEDWLSFLEENSYLASSKLAKEKGTFPVYDEEKYLKHARVTRLSKKVRNVLKKHGIRNATLNSIAPTGTTSLYAGNVSSGVEPIFALSFERKVDTENKTTATFTIEDYAYKVYIEHFRGNRKSLPSSFITSSKLSPEKHLKVQSTIQNYIDASISKTINCPKDISFRDFKNVYMNAYNLGCKGCTTYKPNSIRGFVLKENEIV